MYQLFTQYWVDYILANFSQQHLVTLIQDEFFCLK
jgi:hypothetical protein